MTISRLSGIRPRPIINSTDYISTITETAPTPKQTIQLNSKDTDPLDLLETYTLQKKEEFIVDYDPELDMGEARFKEANISYENLTPHTTNVTLKPSKVVPVNVLALSNNSRLSRHLTHKDQYLTFSSIDSILMYFLTDPTFPKGRYRLYYQISKVNKATKQTFGELNISKGGTLIKMLTLTYSVKKQKLFIFEDKKIVGTFHYDIIPNNVSVELIQGQLYSKNILIDPIWDHDQKSCSKQLIKIGSLTCNAFEKEEAKWQGTFKDTVYKLPFKMKAQVVSVKKKQSKCKKRLFIGQNKLSLNSNFFSDCLTDPYHAFGAMIIN